MLRVYVAGAYSSDTVLGVLGNMKRGIKLGAKVLEAGMAPFVPWLDHDLVFHMSRNPTLLELYAQSISWMRVADAVLVVKQGATESRGTMAEVAEAERLKIPVFWSFEELLNYKEECKANEFIQE